MAHVAEHLSFAELEERYPSGTDLTAARHFQTIWLLAKEHEIAEVSATMSFAPAPRWVERLLARYSAKGAEALGDLRRHNDTAPSILKPELLERLRVAFASPRPRAGGGRLASWPIGVPASLEKRHRRGTANGITPLHESRHLRYPTLEREPMVCSFGKCRF